MSGQQVIYLAMMKTVESTMTTIYKVDVEHRYGFFNTPRPMAISNLVIEEIARIKK